MNITTLAQLIAQVESNGNLYAVRFEPAYRPNDLHVRKMVMAADCSTHTAAVLCTMSWGKYQIMGDNLIKLGMIISPIKFVQDESMQDDFFHRYLASNRMQDWSLVDVMNNPVMLNNFVRAWNGSANVQAYALRMKNIMALSNKVN